jgi:hypothetical protein
MTLLAHCRSHRGFHGEGSGLHEEHRRGSACGSLSLPCWTTIQTGHPDFGVIIACCVQGASNFRDLVLPWEIAAAEADCTGFEQDGFIVVHGYRKVVAG